MVHPKVVASSVAGAATVVLVFVVSQLGVDIPPEVAAAVTVLFTTLAGFLRSSA